LRDAFVGYVVPSKVHACIGSERSDVHLLAIGAPSALEYRQVEVGDVDGLVKVLHAMEKAMTAERRDHPEKAGADWAEFAARAKN
jgi:hypothetical protein